METKTHETLVERLTKRLGKEYRPLPGDPKNAKEFEVYLTEVMKRRVATDFLDHMQREGFQSAMAWLHSEAIDFQAEYIAQLGWELARRDACVRLHFQLLPLAEEYGVSLSLRTP